MKQAVPKGNSKGRGPGFPVPNKADTALPQHGGEGTNIDKKTSLRVGLNKGMSGTPGYAGPGRNL